MKKILKNISTFLIIVSVFLLTGCKWEGTEPPDTFDKFTNNLFLTLVGNDELTSNYLFLKPEDYGLERYEPSLPTPGKSSELGKLILNMYFGSIQMYDYQQLNDDQKMTYNIILDLLNNINAQTSEMSYMSNNYLGSYLGYQAQLPLLLVEYKFKDLLDLTNYFKYLDLVPETFQKYYEFEIEKADNGYGMPDFVIDNVVGQCESFIENILNTQEEHFMISVINKKIAQLDFLTNEQIAYYQNLNRQKVRGPLLEGYQYIKDNLTNLKGRSVNNMGLAHYVKEDGTQIGKKYYEIAFKKAIGYDIPVSDGITYIDNILAEADIKLEYYRNLYQNDSEFRYAIDNLQLMDGTPEEQIGFYQQIIDGHFPRLLKSPNFTIKYVDESMEDNFSPAAYMVSPIDDYENEFIYLNKKSIYKNIVNEEGEIESVLDYNYLYTTLAHEGVPGHMYQNIYFKSKENVNIIRKVLKSTGYMEGWATYTEMYMYRLLEGYSEDVINYLIFNDELSGAIMSRFDMGIHYEGWTFDEAYSFLKKYYPTMNEASALSNYQRIIEVPNNAQYYYFTYFKIRDLYNDISTIMGNEFDPLTFHQYILDCGPAPLKYVEEYVRKQYQ